VNVSLTALGGVPAVVVMIFTSSPGSLRNRSMPVLSRKLIRPKPGTTPVNWAVAGSACGSLSGRAARNGSTGWPAGCGSVVAGWSAVDGAASGPVVVSAGSAAGAVTATISPWPPTALAGRALVPVRGSGRAASSAALRRRRSQSAQRRRCPQPAEPRAGRVGSGASPSAWLSIVS